MVPPGASTDAGWAVAVTPQREPLGAVTEVDADVPHALVSVAATANARAPRTQVTMLIRRNYTACRRALHAPCPKAAQISTRTAGVAMTAEWMSNADASSHGEARSCAAAGHPWPAF